ncbi:hypothetical protein ACRAS1_37675 [Streptomyces lividans]
MERLVALGRCLLRLSVAGGLAVAALADEYEPPALSDGQLAGSGAETTGPYCRPRRSAADGPVPARLRTYRDYTRCSGTGIWTRNLSGDREGVVVRLDCGEETSWTIGGSERSPELFALFGDPDAGDLLFLTRN